MQRRYWTFGSFIVIRRVDLQPGERSYDGLMDSYIDEWLRNPATASVIEDMLRNTPLGSGQISLRSRGPTELRERLANAFRLGELVVLHHERARLLGGSNETPKTDPAPPRPQREKTWIEVQLVNKKGQPVAGARYRLKITDGSIREGKLDERGSVRVPGIDPGMCEITFLDFDAKEWTPA